MRPRALALSLAIFAFACPRVASACWDGVLLETERVRVMIVDEDASWSVEDARQWASEIAQIEALLPEGVSAVYEFGGFYFEDDHGLCELGFDDDGYVAWDEVFDTVAVACHARRSEVRAARAIEAEIYTIQLASLTDAEAAQDQAMRINEGEELCEWHGFYEAGGFPSFNPCAHVVSAELDDGRLVHRVVVGAFTTRAAAEGIRAEIREALGREGMVRQL